MTNSENYPAKPELETESFDSHSSPDSRSKVRAFAVAASPFNGIKIELGIAILLGAILWLAADSITADESAQWLILLGYGLSSMCWLVLRTRAVLHRCIVRDEMSP